MWGLHTLSSPDSGFRVLNFILQLAPLNSPQVFKGVSHGLLLIATLTNDFGTHLSFPLCISHSGVLYAAITAGGLPHSLIKSCPTPDRKSQPPHPRKTSCFPRAKGLATSLACLSPPPSITLILLPALSPPELHIWVGLVTPWRSWTNATSPIHVSLNRPLLSRALSWSSRCTFRDTLHAPCVQARQDGFPRSDS